LATLSGVRADVKMDNIGHENQAIPTARARNIKACTANLGKKCGILFNNVVIFTRLLEIIARECVKPSSCHVTQPMRMCITGSQI
jgi:hypothetical protein